MKLELPCVIVRDLLPSYVEGLTEEQTTAAVKEHLEACEDCRQRYETMSAGDAPSTTAAKEVDYLKQVRKRNHMKILIAAILAVVLVLTGVGAKVFLIGWPCDARTISVRTELSEDGKRLKYNLYNLNSAMAFTEITVHTDPAVLKLTPRQVLVSPLYRSGEYVLDTPIEGIRRVEVCGESVWENGLAISGMTRNLFSLKTPYVGNAAAVNQLISNMDMDAANTLELQTAQKPYGATLHFQWNFAEDRHFIVEGSSYLILALVDNLEKVSWDEPSGWSGSVTLEEANTLLPGLVAEYNRSHNTDYPVLDNVKDYGQDAYHLQVLHNVVIGSHFE